MPEVDSEDEEYLPTAGLDDPVWSEEPVPDRGEYLCIHKISRPETLSPQPNQVEMPETSTLQSDQVVMPPEPQLMGIDIPEDIPDLIDVPEEILLDFDAWAHSVLDYQYSVTFNEYMTFKILDINEHCMYSNSYF